LALASQFVLAPRSALQSQSVLALQSATAKAYLSV
jgi:hypothetical protein